MHFSVRLYKFIGVRIKNLLGLTLFHNKSQKSQKPPNLPGSGKFAILLCAPPPLVNKMPTLPPTFKDLQVWKVQLPPPLGLREDTHKKVVVLVVVPLRV